MAKSLPALSTASTKFSRTAFMKRTVYLSNLYILRARPKQKKKTTNERSKQES